MKIAYLVHDYHRAGGHSRYVAELASRFSQEHEVHVFSNNIETGGEDRIRFHRVPAWRANALTTVLTFALPATFQVGRGFDIVHSQGFCGLRGNVYTAHICNRAWNQALRRWEGGPTAREFVFNMIATTLEYSLYGFIRRSEVIAVSERVARDLLQYYHCKAPTQVMYHGVDLELFSPANRLRWRGKLRAQYGIPDDETLYLYVGDMRKGASKCIEALSQLDGGRLIFVSRSPVDSYRRLAERLAVGNRVLLPGPTNQVEAIYAAADAFVLPTPYDSFGMVVSEAMASALPVIVSREAGASELIQHGINGLLLEDLSSISELAGHMRSLQQNRPWAERLGAAARASVEGMSWDSVAKRTMAIYQRVLQKSHLPICKSPQSHSW